MALVLFAICVLGGFGLLLWSWRESRRLNLLTGIEEAPLDEPTFGRTWAVNGVADSPALLSSPVSNTLCVFYEKQVDVQPTLAPKTSDAGNAAAMGLSLAAKLAWVPETIEHDGGFFLADGDAKAFVFPRGAALRISGEHQNSEQDPGYETTRRITERFIPRGQTVCVIGRPHSVEELLVAARDASLSEVTLKLVIEEGHARNLPCFFDDGDGTFMVADMAFCDLQADTAESAGALFWAGLALLGMGAFIVVAVFLRLM